MIRRIKSRERNQNFTNNVLIQKQPRQHIYYLPCYLRLKIKNIESIQLDRMEGSFAADLLVSVFYSNLPTYIVEQIKDKITLQFNRDSSLQLTKSIQITATQNIKEKVLNYTVRKRFRSKIQGNLFWSPFEVIDLVLVVTLRSIMIQRQDSECQDIIRFNLMDNPNKLVTISSTKDNNYQKYVISPFLTRASYKNSLQDDPNPFLNIHENALIDIDSNQDTAGSQNGNQCQHQKIKYFQYGHFYIGLYKYPFTSLSTMFFPMWSLASYNLFMYFQGYDLSMRISNLTTLNLTLFALVPIIRSQLPCTPHVILTQILLYIIAVTLTLTLIQSYFFSGLNPTEPYYWQSDPWFILSVAFTVLTVVVIGILSLIHKLYWQPGYKVKVGGQYIFQKLNMIEWRNEACNSYFKKFKCIHILKQ